MDFHNIADMIFSSDSPTFRAGKINAWQSELSSPNLALLEETCGMYLDKIGYKSENSLP